VRRSSWCGWRWHTRGAPNSFAMAIASPRSRHGQSATIMCWAGSPRPASVVWDALAVLQDKWKRARNLSLSWQLAAHRLAASSLPLPASPILQAGSQRRPSHPSVIISSPTTSRLNCLSRAGAVLGARSSAQHIPRPVPSPGPKGARRGPCHPSRSTFTGVSACPRAAARRLARKLGRWGKCSFLSSPEGASS